MYQIDNQSRTPVYEQMIKQIENYILMGILPPEEQLPSVRNMSMELHINPNTVQKSYAELDRKGIIYSVNGVGCFVSKEAKEILHKEKRSKLNDLKPVIREIAMSGVTQEVMIELIKSIYQEEIK